MESKVNEFQSLSAKEKHELVTKPFSSKTPLFIERISYALETGSPNSLCFMPKWVIDAYYEIKDYQKQQ